MTQKQAYELDAKQRMQATVSNAMFISGAVLAIGGGALIATSLGDSKVALISTGPGIAVAGSFP